MKNISAENTPAKLSAFFWMFMVLDLVGCSGYLYLASLFRGEAFFYVLALIAIGLSILAIQRGFKVKRLSAIFILSILIILPAYLLLWPVPFEPGLRPESIPNPAGIGVFSENNNLASAMILKSGQGPEGIEPDGERHFYTGLENGQIVRMDLDGNTEVIADTSGRPLGMELNRAGDLIVADAIRGLISINKDGEINELVSTFEGKKLKFVDDLAIASDDKIYFSDVSSRHGYEDYKVEIFEQKPSGRLFVYDPETRETTRLIDDLFFANGVALSADESFVLVNETFGYRVIRYWLSGPKSGTTDVFTENLPGCPDNITEAPDGGFWIALHSPRNSMIDSSTHQPEKLKILWRFSQLLNLPIPKHCYAVKVNAESKVEASLEDSSGNIYALTSVIEHNSKLYLGSNIAGQVGILDLE